MIDVSNIKLLAFDMDGTALDDAGHVTERTRRALQAVADMGIMLVPATGRGFSRLREDTIGVMDIDYAISANGAILYDYRDGIELMRSVIPCEMAACLAEDFTRRTTKIYLQLGNATSSYLANMYDFELFAPLEGGRVWRDNLQEDLPGKLRELGEDVAKLGVVFVNWETEIPEAFDFVAQKYPSLRVFRAERESIEICDKGVSKSRALQTLCERLGIAPEDVCAVGDNGNDVSMITHVGLGVAMANGMDETKAAARVVTDLPNGQEGFADFIEKTFLGL